MEDKNKFEVEDLPKILAAVQTGRTAKQFWTLTVNGDVNGGITGINLKIEKNFK